MPTNILRLRIECDAQLSVSIINRLFQTLNLTQTVSPDANETDDIAPADGITKY